MAKESNRYDWWRQQLHPRVDGRIYQRYEELPIREIWLVDVEEGKKSLRSSVRCLSVCGMLLRMKSNLCNSGSGRSIERCGFCYDSVSCRSIRCTNQRRADP